MIKVELPIEDIKNLMKISIMIGQQNYNQPSDECLKAILEYMPALKGEK